MLPRKLLATYRSWCAPFTWQCLFNRVYTLKQLFKAIIPQARVGYEMIGSQWGAPRVTPSWLSIISYPTSVSGIIVLLKTIKKYCQILLISLCNNQRTIEWSLFLAHGMIAHIPWPLGQSMKLHLRGKHKLTRLEVFWWRHWSLWHIRSLTYSVPRSVAFLFNCHHSVA